jgi:type I restriction enzyme S subunit
MRNKLINDTELTENHFKINGDWELVEIKEITNNLDNRRIPLNSLEREKKTIIGLYPYIGANNIQGYIDEFIFDEKILCLAEDGGSWGFNEKCAIIIDEKCWVNNHAHVLTAKDNLVLEYLMYWLNYNDLSLFINGATRGKLTQGTLNKIKIPLPPLPTQQKIAAILDKADELRQYNKQLIKKYEALTQSLFLDMFGDPVWNEKGWETKTIENITSKTKGSIKRGPFGGALKKEIFVEDGYLVYEQFHALNNDFSRSRYFITQEKFDELKGFEVKPKDIIISCSGVYLGKLAIVPAGAKKGIINQALLKITLDESKMTNAFFVFHFTHKNFRERYFDANRGAGIPNFPPMSDFKKFPFISPPINLQNQFVERVQMIDFQKQQAQEALEKSEALFQGLLQRAFKGELN